MEKKFFLTSFFPSYVCFIYSLINLIKSPFLDWIDSLHIANCWLKEAHLRDGCL